MVLGSKKKHKTTTTPAVVSPPPPSPPPTAKLGDPTGTIGGDLHIAYGRGYPWSNVNRYDEFFIEAGHKYGVDPAMLKAMAIVETGGQMIWNQGGSGAYGLMQIKESDWGWVADKIGADLKTPEGQIHTAAAILGKYGKGAVPDERFLNSYYPVLDAQGKICLDCKGEDGHTPRQYLADMHELIRQITAASGGTTPIPKPKPEPTVDVVQALVGGAPYNDDYGFKSPTNLPYYGYFVGHGGYSNQHTGIDVTGTLGEPLYSPISGTVVCAGTGVGNGAYGSSCAAFPYTLGGNSGSSGRLEILADDGKRSLIIGHVMRCLVGLNQKVKPGQHVADMGGMNGPHAHLEARVWENGNYTILDPRQVFGGVSGVHYVERVPYNFDMESQPAPNIFTVKALKKLNIYQRADPHAEILDTIEAGETFQAVALIPGNDGKPWYLGVHNGRVPTADTEIVEAP